MVFGFPREMRNCGLWVAAMLLGPFLSTQSAWARCGDYLFSAQRHNPMTETETPTHDIAERWPLFADGSPLALDALSNYFAPSPQPSRPCDGIHCSRSTMPVMKPVIRVRANESKVALMTTRQTVDATEIASNPADALAQWPLDAERILFRPPRS